MERVDHWFTKEPGEPMQNDLPDTQLSSRDEQISLGYYLVADIQSGGDVRVISREDCEIVEMDDKIEELIGGD